MPVHPGRGSARSRPRPLGLLTVRSPSFLEKEKREFRQGLTFISQIIQNENNANSREFSEQNTALFNNANSARYYNRVPNKVVESTSGHFRPVSSACSRASSSDLTSASNLQCEVLGPMFCVECARTRLKEMNCEKHRAMFPYIEDGSSGALVSPDRLYPSRTSPPDRDSNYGSSRTLDCGSNINATDILSNVLFTEHDVHSRVRSAHQIGTSIVDRRMVSDWSRPDTLDIKCETPDNYGVNASASVHFNSPTEVGRHFFLE